MGNEARIGLTVALLLNSTAAGLAQGSTSTGQSIPDSNMAAPSGNTGGANNGIGQQGSLTANNGSHASTATGSAAAAQIPISPKSSTQSRNDPRVENEPALGGGQQH
jgi:hypothetical protein